MATGGVANVGVTAGAEGGSDDAECGVAGAAAAPLGVGAAVGGAIGFWAWLSGNAKSAAAMASGKISLDARCFFDRGNEAIKDSLRGTLIAEGIGYMSRKLRIIW